MIVSHKTVTDHKYSGDGWVVEKPLDVCACVLLMCIV